jgi:hypothetical protein
LQDPEPDPDALVRGTDPRIRIRTKMSRIRNTAYQYLIYFCWKPMQLVQILVSYLQYSVLCVVFGLGQRHVGDRCPAALFSIETSVQLLNHFLFNMMRGKSNLNRIILIRTFFFSLNTNNGYRESVFLWFLYGTVLGKNPCKIFCKRL